MLVNISKITSGELYRSKWDGCIGHTNIQPQTLFIISY